MFATAMLLLSLRIYDAIALSPEETRAAMHAAAHAFAAADVELSIVVCGRGPRQPESRCNVPPLRSEVMVRLVAAPLGTQAGALGVAYLAPDGGPGQLATVFVDRVRRLAVDGHVDSGTLIGRAVVHEIVHLLSGPQHSHRGTMRPFWSGALLRTRPADDWVFSSDEVARLRHDLEMRLHTPFARNGLVELPPRPSCIQPSLVCAQSAHMVAAP